MVFAIQTTMVFTCGMLPHMGARLTYSEVLQG